MKKVAVFPGSFDPFTKGHESVVRNAHLLFDEIVIAFGINTTKKYVFDIDKRMEHVRKIYEDDTKISVLKYHTLTVDLCKSLNAQFILRGLRDTTDFEYERSIALMNKQISGVETVLLYTSPEVAGVNSTIIREIYKLGGDIKPFVTNSNYLVE